LAAIEASEGHAVFPAGAALLGLILAASIVVILARLTCDWLGDWGSFLARIIRAFAFCAPRPLVALYATVPAASIPRRGRRRGRAPPHFA
jgi:hypothetical protein